MSNHKARLDKLTAALSFGATFCSMEEMAHYWLAKKTGRCTLDDAPPHVQRGVHYSAIYAALHTILEPESLRRDLEGTRQADVHRKQMGWPVSLMPDREERWQAQIKAATDEALETLQTLGLTAPVEPQVLADRLVELGDDAGFSDEEMRQLKQRIRGRLDTVEWKE
jgi:hypothetical protein